MGGVLLCASFKCHALLERVQMLNDSMETFCSHSNICLSRRAHAKVRASFEAAGLKGCQDARIPCSQLKLQRGCWHTGSRSMMMRAKWQGFARRHELRLPVCKSYLCLFLCLFVAQIFAQLLPSAAGGGGGKGFPLSACVAANEISAVS